MKFKHFSPSGHVGNLISKPYYHNLVLLRDVVERACDEYFGLKKSPKVDLYLVSKAVSSPMGLGSDSVPIQFHLDKDSYYLSDSSQFGMEPLVINSFDMVYCYLPSFRGEDADARHMNQFYHCEAELRGGLGKAMNVAEELVKHILKSVKVASAKKKIRFEKMLSVSQLDYIIKNKFKVITFDKAMELLEKDGKGDLVEKKKFGRVLTGEGERYIASKVGNNKIPVWITHYDRDTVAFYQKPDTKDKNKVLNADLILPLMFKGSFGGETLGLGQRQDTSREILESMKRQGVVNSGQYDWYIRLRKHPKYKITSGFGLGIERLLTWTLGLPTIADTALYPVLKNLKTGY